MKVDDLEMSYHEAMTFIMETIMKSFQVFNSSRKTIVLHFGYAEVIIAPKDFWNEYLENRAIEFEKKGMQ